MRKTIEIILITSVFLCVSCSSMKKDAGSAEGRTVIRYINLRSVYAFLLNKDERAAQMKTKREKISAAIDENKLRLLGSDGAREELYRRLNENRNKLNELSIDEENYKAALLARINTAVRKTAESAGVDFILNMGDEVIYGKKKYDITDQVIKELERIEARTDPVSR